MKTSQSMERKLKNHFRTIETISLVKIYTDYHRETLIWNIGNAHTYTSHISEREKKVVEQADIGDSVWICDSGDDKVLYCSETLEGLLKKIVGA